MSGDMRRCTHCRQSLKFLAAKTNKKRLNLYVCPTCDKPMHEQKHLVWRTD